MAATKIPKSPILNPLDITLTPPRGLLPVLRTPMKKEITEISNIGAAIKKAK